MIKEKLNRSYPPLSHSSATVTAGLDSAAVESTLKKKRSESRPWIQNVLLSNVWWARYCSADIPHEEETEAC